MTELEALKKENAELKEKVCDLMIRNDYLEEYQKSLGAGSLYTFEIDFTDDIFISASDLLLSQQKENDDKSYSKMIETVLIKQIEESDIEKVRAQTSCAYILQMFNNGIKNFSIDYQSKMNWGQPLWFRLHIYLIQHPVSGHICGIVTISNIDSLKTAELELIDRAQHDSLTKLYNRYSMENLISSTLRSSTSTHGLLMMDIDNFKHINDTYGHQTGDTMLVAFANLLTKQFRKYDIIARFGGDEFVVLLKDASQEIVIRRANEICEKAKELVIPGTNEHISSSIGVALYPQHGYGFEELLSCADEALYISKNNGKGKSTTFVPKKDRK